MYRHSYGADGSHSDPENSEQSFSGRSFPTFFIFPTIPQHRGVFYAGDVGKRVRRRPLCHKTWNSDYHKKDTGCQKFSHAKIVSPRHYKFKIESYQIISNTYRINVITEEQRFE